MGAGMGAGMRMGPPAAAGWHPALAGVSAQALAGLPAWTLMIVAMMGPAALPRIRHVGRASPHPVRAMAGFAAAYLATWAAFGVLVQAGAAVVPGIHGAPALALALAGAVAWQLSPLKRSLLRACHRATAGQYAAAARDAADGSGRVAPTVCRAARHGAGYGLCCLGACWCLMLAMVAVPAGQLFWLAGLAALVTAERLMDDSGDAVRAAAAALGVATVATLAVGGLL